MQVLSTESEKISLKQLCERLSVSIATGRNWIKLNKIVPDFVVENTPYFKIDYVNQLMSELKQSDNLKLKSRRNKKYVSGNDIYLSYISDVSKNLKNIQELINAVKESEISLSDEVVSTLLVFYARRWLTTEYDFLLQDIINKFGYLDNLVEEYPNLFSFNLLKEPSEDILGLIYLSLKNLSSRKSMGSYYTPTKIVRKLCSALFIDNDLSKKTVYDPCCGTGNFILQLPNGFSAKNVYASDIDAMSVFIARINLVLKFGEISKDILYSNIFQCDYLEYLSDRNYDYIIGNPPWGCEFSSEQKKYLRENFVSAKGANIESYDVVVEKALSELQYGGILSFVLPEAFLNVKAHTEIRKYVIQKYSISYIEYLGEVFDGVQCPSVILQIVNTNKPFSTKGLFIKSKVKQFKISTYRDVNAESLNFLIDDVEYLLLKKILNISNKVTLKDNAKFALGIVTGDNKKYVSPVKNNENEMVLKGSNLQKFIYKSSDSYINFKADEFQQVAPIEFYRAKEKLFYKFISDKLVFAYDNKQILSLNSCNILIPQIEGLSIKYVMAVLNSSVAQFFYEKQFNSIKVLRSHLEQIPIPFVDNIIQKNIEKLVDEILVSSDERYIKLCNDLDLEISKLYGLTNEDVSLLK